MVLQPKHGWLSLLVIPGTKPGNPSTKNHRKICLSALEVYFLVKYLSGRTIEFDVIIESEQVDQSSAMTEIVPEMATMFIALMSTKSCIHGNLSIY